MLISQMYWFWIFIIAISACESSAQMPNDDNEYENLEVELKLDEKSSTTYHLTYIDHKDKNGKLLKLNHAHANRESGETVLEFAKRVGNPLIAINASQGIPGLEPDKKQAAGIQIIDKKIIQDEVYKKYAHTLGIKDNNELMYFKPGTRGQEMLDAGVNNALCGFVPLIVDHEPVSDDILTLTAGIQQQHPRQIIAQFDNLDLLILSCGGRGYGGEGMSADDVIRILQDYEKDVKFAFMLDGGGSVTTVIESKVITKRIDANGTELRPRSNFLYIK